MAKLLTSIVAADISNMIEKEQLLPGNHFGGQPGWTTTDAVHTLVNKIKSARRCNKAVSVLYLDVEGAFPDAVTDRLLHNLQKRGIPVVYIQFIKVLLTSRCTCMKFDNFLSDFILISNGIRQGDPLSMLLYIVYNADLLEITENPGEDSLEYVDDALVMAEGNDLEETVEILTNFMTREDEGFAWSEAHNSKFALHKLAVSHFTRRRMADPVRPGHTIIRAAPALILRGEEVKVSPAYKYLGIHIDSLLNWKTQCYDSPFYFYFYF